MSSSQVTSVRDDETEVHLSSPETDQPGNQQQQVTAVLKTTPSVENEDYVSKTRQNKVDSDNDNEAPAVMNMTYVSRMIEKFKGSGNLAILEVAISLLRESLKDMPTGSSTYLEGTNMLGSALFLRFRQQGEAEDLKETISTFRQALELCSPHSDRSTSLDNPSSALQTGDGQNLDKATRLNRGAPKFTPLPSPDLSEFLSNLAVALRTRFQQGGEDRDLDEAISLHRQALKYRLPPHPYRSQSLNNLALALQTRFQEHGEEEDLNEAISFHRQALELRPSPHPDRANSFNSLASALHIRFLQRGEASDLNDAILFYRQGFQLRPPRHPNHFDFLFNLTSALKTRFFQKGDKRDLDEVIALQRQALNFSLPFNSWHFDLLNGLASALETRFKQNHELQDLEEAITFRRQSLELELLPNQDRYISVNNLAMALQKRFKQLGEVEDLDDAISLHKRALEFVPALHPSYPDFLNNLAAALQIRFEQGSEGQYLDDAIELYRQAVKHAKSRSTSHVNFLSNLASALETQFKRRGDAKDLDEAISFRRQALEHTPQDDQNHIEFINYLAIPLQIRFKQRGDVRDLDEAISLHRKALKFRSPSHPDRSISLNNLAAVLQNRFEQGAKVEDLNEAILLYRQALDTKPAPHSTYPEFLNNLASMLRTRFEEQGNALDLDEAVSLHRQALELGPPSYTYHGEFISNLAAALQTCFEKRGEAEDMDEAILLHRQALEHRPPPHTDHSRCLSNLGLALQTRFEKRGKARDLDEAISLLRKALSFRLSPHPYRSLSLNNLATALRTRFEKHGEAQDLGEAILLYKQTLDLLPLSHQNRPGTLQNLAVLHISANKKIGIESGHTHLEQAMFFFSQAAHFITLAPSRRFYTARMWALYADLYQHSSALDAYHTALDVLPQLAALNLDMQSRQNVLATGIDGMARKAARSAIHINQLTKAVEFLETGRGVFWSQYLQLRSPFDRVPDTAKELKEELKRISIALERGSHRDIASSDLDNRYRLSLEEEAQHYEQLATQWSNTIDKVRKLEGLQDFLRPPTLSTLQAAKETVVYLIANDNVSDCLILTSTQVYHVPLPKLSTHTLSGLVKLIRIATSKYTVPYSFIKKAVGHVAMQAVSNILQPMDSGKERGVKQSDPNPISSHDTFRFILRLIWDEVVKPVINLLGLKKSNTPSMLRWYPTGLFTFIPVHAAGQYDKDSVDCASDYFISSYTPTVGALLTQRPVSTTEPFKMMAVIQPRSLPGTKVELEKIQKHVAGDSLITFGVPTMPASVDVIASHLSGASIVHFACHGKQDPKKPLESGLIVEDGLLKISRIMKEVVPNGSLAFLSACETGMGDENIPDEAMSIGMSLLFAGFRNVIATMWNMSDEDGSTIADAFYKELFKDSDGNRLSRPDTTKSAHAIHIAVKELRSSGVPFQRWVPFIHMGK